MKTKRELAKLIVVNKKLASNLFITHKEFVFQNKENRLIELILSNKNLSEELEIAHKELAFQQKEKEKRAAELVIANKELAFQSEEKQKRADELFIANKELAFQSEEKQKRADELFIANKELVFQSTQKEKRADELVIANKELAFQNDEKQKRADELVIANKELAFQNDEKQKRADELFIANKELVFQSTQKEKRADELIVANKEKAKRASELIITNTELDYQAELAIANEKLSNQYAEKASRTDELVIANIKVQKSLQLNADKDLFISILAHDLRNPFNALLGLSNLLLENIRVYDTTEVEELLNLLNKSAKNTSKLLEDILMWARAQSGSIPFEPQKLNLLKICTDISNFFHPIAHIKEITINFSSVEDIPVFADSNMIEAIFRNLISNAIKFTNKGGQIDIYSKTDQKNIIITVSDNGIGLKKDTLKKLFNVSKVFSTNGTADENGTGLGLVLCKQFIEKHNGEIWVESEFGKGSKFSFTLPMNTNHTND